MGQLLRTQRMPTVGAVIMLSLVVALVIVWPLPHVIALRNTLLISLLVWLIAARWPPLKWSFAGSVFKWPSLCLAALLVWLFVVALWVDTNPATSLSGIKGEWLPPLVAFAVGALMVGTLTRKGMSQQLVMKTVFGSLMLLIVLQFGLGTWYLLFEGGLPGFFGGITDHKANITYVAAITLSMLLADATARTPEVGFLGLPRWLQLGSFAVLVITTYMSGTRNGIVIVLLLTVIWAPFFLINVLRLSRRATLMGFLGLALCMAVAAWAMIKIDKRWSRLLVTVPVAWNVEGDHSWLWVQKMGLPLAADGLPVEATAYERISWAIVAVKLIIEHPLGTSISKDAFRQLVEVQYGPTRTGHAHNGYLDLGLEAGVPAVLLWLVFLILLLRLGVVNLRGPTYASLALILYIIGFGTRSALDAILRDHILEQFMFFAALFLAVSDGREFPQES